MNELIKILKVLADKNRLRILNLLKNTKRMCVCELVYVIDITQPSISKHLKKMKEAELITDEHDSFWTYYQLNEAVSDPVNDIITIITSKLKKDIDCIKDLEKAKTADRTSLCCN